METVSEFAYLGDRVSAGGGCEAVVTARARCGWVKLKVRLSVGVITGFRAVVCL